MKVNKKQMLNKFVDGLFVFLCFSFSLGDITYFRKTQTKSKGNVICRKWADEARSILEM